MRIVDSLQAVAVATALALLGAVFAGGIWVIVLTNDDPPSAVAYTAACAVGLLLDLLAFVYFDRVLLNLRLILKSLRRNPVRSALTSLATVVMVLMVTLIWTVLTKLDEYTTERSQDFKAIVTERWQQRSEMPPSYVRGLSEGAAKKSTDVRPQDSMTWTFYGGTIDGAKLTRESMLFFFAMEPSKLMRVERDAQGNALRRANGKLKYSSMMEVDSFTDEQMQRLDLACREMEKDRTKVLIGAERLQALNKRVGERLRVASFNYPGIDLEVEIIGELPKGRYGHLGLVNREYILRGMDAYEKKNGKAHPMAQKSVNLVWLKVPDTDTFRQLAEQIMDSPLFTKPAVKVETEASGIAAFIDSYRGILWMFRWLVVPAILATMAVVIANAISISVRERRTEMAVLKVLGFGPTQILILVLGEAVLIGAMSGFVSSAVTYWAINSNGGLPFPIVFIPVFLVPTDALWWGLAVGGLTALAGSILPAWSARSVKVAEVFAKQS